MVMVWPTQLIASLLPRRLWFRLKVVHMGFVVDKLAWGTDFSPSTSLFSVIVFALMFYTCILFIYCQWYIILAVKSIAEPNSGSVLGVGSAAACLLGSQV